MSTFQSHPPPEDWNDFVDFESTSWPKKERRRYWIIPSICFNCESACGILAYVDQQTLEVRKIEGNPLHPGSRGRTCAKGVVTPNQLDDPDRILYPLRRVGGRGDGRWQQVSWDEALEDIGGRIRRAIVEGRRREVMYHVGRPGEDGYANRVLEAWGIDGHNSHTNVCSSSARLGHFLWCGDDRPSPDYANARTILLLSSHLESGHYFNPHAQRIVEAKADGATLIVMDPRLSNTSAKADLWLPAYSGTEGAALLAMARILLEEDLYDREFVRRWVNWKTFLRAQRPDAHETFDAFIAALKDEYAQFTPEFAEAETGIPAAQIVEAARAIGRAGSRFATHNWRAAASGNLWGWQITRCLYLLVVLTGSIGTVGGVNMHLANKFVPKHPNPPPPPEYWNELLFPKEFPLAFFEMSFLLPHFLKEGRGRLDVYFTRVYNPLWTNPDGFSWMEVLQDTDKIGLHVALTPTWSETAWFADYILPMGLGTERHDTMSQETHAGQWLGFRQPVVRVAREKRGERVAATYEANPGEVWEESEFWIALSWKIDPDGALGIRQYFESPARPGSPITLDEYYGWIFEHSVPGLPEAAAREQLTPLAYMRKYGVFQVSDKSYSRGFERELEPAELAGTTVAAGDTLMRDGTAVGLVVDGIPRPGFRTPSRRLELFSQTMVDWGWPEHAVPRYVPGHVHWRDLRRQDGEFDLMPNFRLPTLIHTRSPVKWLYEISHDNPLWIATEDARRVGVATGDLVKVRTRIGSFVTRAWVTEGIRPGVLGMSHHLGRWRLQEEQGGARAASSLVRISRDAGGRYTMKQVHGAQPFESPDPDSGRVWWSEVGVHQNLTFPVQPDPVSGMHCWHQRVRLEKAGPGDSYGDVMVDTAEAHQAYKEWMAQTRPAPGPDGLRRPVWFDRPLRPAAGAYRMGPE